MKSIFYFFIVAMAILNSACSKIDNIGVISNDKTKPGPVTNLQVKNINGAAIITYKLPSSSNILYVLSDYVINDKTGTKRQTKSSYYTDTTLVDGFAEAKEYEVKLTVYSRAGIASDPVTVKVRPDEPVYKLVRQQIAINPDFSAINVSAQNVQRKKVGVILLYDDPAYGKYVVRQQIFNNFQEINFTSRGLDTIPKKVAVYVTDEFGNLSDTLYKTVKPLYEIALDRTKFFPYKLASDKPTYPGNYAVNNLWNNLFGEDLWHTDVLSGSAAAYPYNATFGIGSKAKLSRFTLWQRPAWGFTNGSWKVFSIWGSNKDLPGDVVFPMGVNEGTTVGDWVNLGNFNFPNPPSGNAPTSATTADIQFLTAGVDFTFPISAPAVKYIRISVEQTWGRVTLTGASEFRLYGDPVCSNHNELTLINKMQR